MSRQATIGRIQRVRPIRRDNKLLDIVELIEAQKSLKAFVERLFLHVHDFNILVAVMESNKQPTAEQPTEGATVSYLVTYCKQWQDVIRRSLNRLRGLGFVLLVEGHRRKGIGRHQVNTYHLTKAGRDLINSYYESEFCKLKR